MDEIKIKVKDLNSVSDGFHTMQELYSHRCILFACLINCNKGISWKSKEHSDGSMFDGWFICGINTEIGNATYHLPIDMWGLLDCKALIKSPEWKGETPQMCLEMLENEFCLNDKANEVSDE